MHILNYPHYTVICESDCYHLEMYVNNLIEEGWEPTGGVFINNTPDGFTLWYQAMVNRKSRSKKKPAEENSNSPVDP